MKKLLLLRVALITFMFTNSSCQAMHRSSSTESVAIEEENEIEPLESLPQVPLGRSRTNLEDLAALTGLFLNGMLGNHSESNDEGSLPNATFLPKKIFFTILNISKKAAKKTVMSPYFHTSIIASSITSTYKQLLTIGIIHGITLLPSAVKKAKDYLEIHKLKKNDPESYAELQHVAALQNNVIKDGNRLAYISGNQINNHVAQSVQAKVAEKYLAKRMAEKQEQKMLGDLEKQDPESFKMVQGLMELQSAKKQLADDLKKIQEAEEMIAKKIEANSLVIGQDTKIVADFSDTDPLATKAKPLLEKSIQDRTKENIALALQRTQLLQGKKKLFQQQVLINQNLNAIQDSVMKSMQERQKKSIATQDGEPIKAIQLNGGMPRMPRMYSSSPTQEGPA